MNQERKQMTSVEDFKKGYLYEEVSAIAETSTIDLCFYTTHDKAKLRVVQSSKHSAIYEGTEYIIHTDTLTTYNIYEIGPYEDHAELLV